MRVLICGSRTFEFYEIIDKMIELDLAWDMDSVVIEGEAEGADRLARISAEGHGVKVEKYPADWKTWGRGAGPIRNQQMLDEGRPEQVWAFFTDLKTSRGTRDMVRRALNENVPVVAIEARRIPKEEL